MVLEYCDALALVLQSRTYSYVTTRPWRHTTASLEAGQIGNPRTIQDTAPTFNMIFNGDRVQFSMRRTAKTSYVREMGIHQVSF